MQSHRTVIKEFLTIAKLMSDQNDETLISYLIQMALLEVATPGDVRKRTLAKTAA